MCDGVRARDGAARERRRCCDGGNSFLMEWRGRSGGGMVAVALRLLIARWERREKEREHLDGMVEASPVNIAPISGGLQPQPHGEVVGGQQDLLRRILAEGAARPYLKPIGELRLHLRQGLLIRVENLGC
ncbi:hypothetical protein LR48_Vigan08g002400 [Vigna angularis]|uniref:Uncharacterized protein n=1 Tax=Phaseolus angularis TaxID=3914 RepID=A0A0L9V2S4_PHAAN|nr:hypothetical protein LR48_Vigan08g002400 [Vigna angularis]